MNHTDYIDYSCHDSDTIPDSVHNFINEVSAKIGQQIDYTGTGKAILLPTQGK
jgi:adenylosuccinate synthase